MYFYINSNSEATHVTTLSQAAQGNTFPFPHSVSQPSTSRINVTLLQFTLLLFSDKPSVEPVVGEVFDIIRRKRDSDCLQIHRSQPKLDLRLTPVMDVNSS